MLLRIASNVILVLLLGAPFFFFERRFAAHHLSYRKVLARDVGALVVATALSLVATAFLQRAMVAVDAGSLRSRAPSLSPWVGIPVAIVGSDFALYWTHRAIHTRPLWRIHRWHHAPGHMYWLAGVRTSFVQGILYSSVTFVFIVVGVPPVFLFAYPFFSTLVNHWMHSNLGFRCRWLETFLVTPRIHHVHHSKDPRHHGRNFGSIFCVWDRLFGTFFDPDDVSVPLEFGIPEVVSPPRIALGV
jgi:sterol desaturase/sphingolipid hydroxylase (fatty acid hydroxylase superfamily)